MSNQEKEIENRGSLPTEGPSPTEESKKEEKMKEKKEEKKKKIDEDSLFGKVNNEINFAEDNTDDLFSFNNDILNMSVSEEKKKQEPKKVKVYSTEELFGPSKSSTSTGDEDLFSMVDSNEKLESETNNIGSKGFDLSAYIQQEESSKNSGLFDF